MVNGDTFQLPSTPSVPQVVPLSGVSSAHFQERRGQDSVSLFIYLNEQMEAQKTLTTCSSVSQILEPESEGRAFSPK